jgi:hypothetical protein
VRLYISREVLAIFAGCVNLFVIDSIDTSVRSVINVINVINVRSVIFGRSRMLKEASSLSR